MPPRRIRAIGFDFDGTLIMSEEAKAKEMAKVFREKFGIEDNIQKEYAGLAGKSWNRNQKVEYLFRKYVHRTPRKKELRAVEHHFGTHYKQSLKTCPLFQCTNVIKELKNQVDFLFLLSLENKPEVVQVAKHCGLATYFDEIRGGPLSKRQNLKHILKKHHLRAKEVIYIGDAHSDVVAGKSRGIKVILLGKKHVFETLKEDLEADFRFSSLCELPHSVNTL